MSDDNQRDEQPKVHYVGGIPLFPSAEDLANAKEDAEARRERAYKDQQLSTNRKIANFTFALFVCTSVMGLITAWQTRIAQESANTSEKSVLVAQKGERDSRKSSEDQARQSASVLQATIDQFHQDQRAWVSRTSVKLTKPYSLDSNGEITIALANTGKTPALRTRITRAGFAATENVPMKPTRQTGWTTQAPGSTLNTMTFGLPPVSANAVIFIRFEVSYRVVFQKKDDPPHVTAFCGFYPTSTPPLFYDCPHGGSSMN